MPAPDYVDFAGLVNQDRRQAVEDARTQVLNQRNDQQYSANQAAGRYLAGGDYQGASGALAASGQLQPALAITQAGQQAKDYARQQSIITAKQQEATSYADRDYTGAASAAALQGDPQAVLAAQDQGLKVHQAQQQYLQQAVPVLTKAFQVHGADGVTQALTALAPELQARGMKPEDTQALITHAQQDPEGAINAINATAQIKWSAPVKIGESTYIYNEANPTQKLLIGQGPITIKPGERVAYPDSAGGAVGGGGPAPAPSSAAPAPVASGAPHPAPSGGAYDQVGQIASGLGATPQETDYLKRTLRIESGGNPNARNGSSTGLFQFHPATFNGVLPGGNISDPNDQTQAALNLARRDTQVLNKIGVPVTPGALYVMHQQGAGGGPALLSAPPGTGAVAALEGAGISHGIAVASIAGNMGLPYRTPEQRAAANQAAMQMSAGQFVDHWNGAMGGGGVSMAASGEAQAVVSPQDGAPPGYHFIGGGQPLFRPATAQELKGTGYAAAQIDTATGEIKHGVKTSEQALADLPPGTGDQLLSQLKPGEAAMIKAYAEGRAPIPTAAALRSPQTQRLMQLAAQYDPTFDGVNYPARAATRKDFTSGKSAANVASYNTAIGHLGEMVDAIPGLGNQNGVLGMVNPANQFFQTTIAHNPNISKFNAAKTALAEELTSTFRSGGGSVKEVEDFQRQMDTANSPQQLVATAQTFARLIGSRIDAKTQQYNQGMGTTADAPPGLTPHAKQILNRIAGAQLFDPTAPTSVAASVIRYDAQGNRVGQ